MTRNLFRERREAAGKTAKEAGRVLGVGASRFLQKERARDIGYDGALRLARFYGCRIDDFIFPDRPQGAGTPLPAAVSARPRRAPGRER